MLTKLAIVVLTVRIGALSTGGNDQMRCKECGSRNPKSVTSCARCGAPLRPSRPKVQSELTESSSAERRRVTVVFCDLVGSTELSGQLDPEELDDVVRKYRNAAADVIRRQGGHILQFLGDGVLACFGYPIGHEDDARRAVRAAQEMLESFAELASSWKERYQIEAGLGIGINEGDVVAGNIGSSASNVSIISVSYPRAS